MLIVYKLSVAAALLYLVLWRSMMLASSVVLVLNREQAFFTCLQQKMSPSVLAIITWWAGPGYHYEWGLGELLAVVQLWVDVFGGFWETIDCIKYCLLVPSYKWFEIQWTTLHEHNNKLHYCWCQWGFCLQCSGLPSQSFLPLIKTSIKCLWPHWSSTR